VAIAAAKKEPPTPEESGADLNERELCLRTPDVLRLRALWTLGHVEFDLFTLRERFETFALDAGVMDENVRAALLLNETETLLVIEPLHFALCHGSTPFAPAFYGVGPSPVILLDRRLGRHSASPVPASYPAGPLSGIVKELL
jgi:hypothetical protein